MYFKYVFIHNFLPSFFHFLLHSFHHFLFFIYFYSFQHFYILFLPTFIFHFSFFFFIFPFSFFPPFFRLIRFLFAFFILFRCFMCFCLFLYIYFILFAHPFLYSCHSKYLLPGLFFPSFVPAHHSLDFPNFSPPPPYLIFTLVPDPDFHPGPWTFFSSCPQHTYKSRRCNFIRLFDITWELLPFYC